jgi:Ni,Fe-hydrogenase I large subunit
MRVHTPHMETTGGGLHTAPVRGQLMRNIIEKCLCHMDHNIHAYYKRLHLIEFSQYLISL